ncbi:type II toxin-antitoxin system Phd/YefM family antitoxin [Methylophilus sp. 14]|uniref:type II toxin-antitoxin system Phd/YefM family antitoxin n=1 Tax=Methylophilus sp. 14 TaxID=2781019 RepID=UPI00188F3C12|nr:type II toxin-antitoxin system Phd/YefM family antitoxin [Methylophilus sp. 14]MBF4989377.1 type II toxin-antitoxin system Phd/YefM family antitoxin [Methylophilus sp. 14]
MNSWPVQDAKSRFSELLDTCLSEGPQVVTRRGAETAVLVPMAEWKRLNNTARPSLKALLLGEDDRIDLMIPARGNANRRVVSPL